MTLHMPSNYGRDRAGIFAVGQGFQLSDTAREQYMVVPWSAMDYH